MNDKFREFGKQLLDAVTPGGVEHSVLGTRIDVSPNGTTSVPTQDLKTILFKRFDEMNRSVAVDSASAAPRSASRA